MRRRATEYIEDIGVDIPSVKTPVVRLSGGQRQAIAIARSMHSDARILLLDEPLAAMGVREGAMILDLIQRLREAGEVSIIMILHNYVHVFQACDRLNLLRDGEIVLDKPTAQSSVEELTELVVHEYRSREESVLNVRLREDHMHRFRSLEGRRAASGLLTLLAAPGLRDRLQDRQGSRSAPRRTARPSTTTR